MYIKVGSLKNYTVDDYKKGVSDNYSSETTRFSTMSMQRI